MGGRRGSTAKVVSRMGTDSKSKFKQGIQFRERNGHVTGKEDRNTPAASAIWLLFLGGVAWQGRI